MIQVSRISAERVRQMRKGVAECLFTHWVRADWQIGVIGDLYSARWINGLG